mgnify:CR=1 FL=1
MTVTEQIITIALCALATMLTRFLPFLLFSGKRKTPEYITYLGKALPAAIFGMLVVYCLKSVNFFATPYGIPEFGAVALTAAVHIYKRNTLLSIALGTACYMLLIRII